MNTSIETVPKLRGLPAGLPRESAVEIEVAEGVLLFRISKIAQQKIELLLDKQKTAKLTASEESELDRYEEIDDYLSFLNRLTRNLVENASKGTESGS